MHSECAMHHSGSYGSNDSKKHLHFQIYSGISFIYTETHELFCGKTDFLHVAFV